MRLNLPILAMLSLTACMAPPPETTMVTDPFSAEQFFAAHTEGEGVLKVMLSPRRTVHVHGNGHVDRDGTLILDQTVDEQGKPPRQRKWSIRRLAPGRYSGSLTDAIGPVTGDVTGNRLHLHFHMEGGLSVDQWLDLLPGGQKAHNHLTVRKFGMMIATLDETIHNTS